MAYGALQSRPGDDHRGATLRSLQRLLLLAFLVLASVIPVTASDAASNEDGVAVTEKSSMDEPSSASDLAVREDVEADAQDEEARSDRLLRPEDEGQLLSNVELKTVSRHTADKKKGLERSGAAADGGKPKAGSKASSAADEEKEAKERAKYKEIYGKAAKEAAETARAQVNVPKSERYHRLIGPTQQDAEYKKLQEDLAKLSPEQREKLIEKRRKEEQEKKDTKKKSDEVMKELKQKLKEREERKAGPAKSGKP